MQPKRQHFTIVFWLVALGLMWLANVWVSRATAPQPVRYDELVAAIRAGEVAEVEVRETEIVARRKDGAGDKPALIKATRLPGIDETRLVDDIEKSGARLVGRIDQTPWWQPLLLGWVLPLGLLMALYWYGMKKMARGGGALSFGKSKVKIYDRNQTERVTFADVAGVDEAKQELREIVDFLANPDKYAKLGARLPKGTLLVGPPGTGKTLLARAVAGEANVPFFSLSGSEFVEMFVGVGAARMRDLFEQAKSRAPCIVFIDEIDAIGKSRGGLGAMATHDEREQTLNQLLVEIDGFDSSQGVVIMAATNRPEVLDPALLRAGRFDRQVVVDRPDVNGRRAILEVHARQVRLGDDVDLAVIAQRTPGMVGADLANVVNEAALAAARRGSERVQMCDFEEAVDRIQLGLEKRGRIMSPEEKRRVAFHEAGHTLIALSVDHADPVHRVTIIPRSVGALGATLQLPTQDRYLLTEPELRDRIAVMLGGRAAETIATGELSTGAQNDLERATETARQMVCRFGMSDKLGPVTFGRPLAARFLDTPLGEERNYSEHTAQLIDAEVRRVVDEQYDRVEQILSAKREALERLATALLAKETLDRDEILAIVRGDGAAGDRADTAPAAAASPTT
ncbi:MAG: ATP-dependent metallopeptidase FtsH/Yme1/Tma family protein [Deltaproteobacteria bacterium]|nr:MAG: ATP-dependent metallopeptidase FtsH/Yme1/Tma family protein [Deltaproteobacteria bacterium]